MTHIIYISILLWIAAYIVCRLGAEYERTLQKWADKVKRLNSSNATLSYSLADMRRDNEFAVSYIKRMDDAVSKHMHSLPDFIVRANAYASSYNRSTYVDLEFKSRRTTCISWDYAGLIKSCPDKFMDMMRPAFHELADRALYDLIEDFGVDKRQVAEMRRLKMKYRGMEWRRDGSAKITYYS